MIVLYSCPLGPKIVILLFSKPLPAYQHLLPGSAGWSCSDSQLFWDFIHPSAVVSSVACLLIFLFFPSTVLITDFFLSSVVFTSPICILCRCYWCGDYKMYSTQQKLSDLFTVLHRPPLVTTVIPLPFICSTYWFSVLRVVFKWFQRVSSVTLAFPNLFLNLCWTHVSSAVNSWLE